MTVTLTSRLDSYVTEQPAPLTRDLRRDNHAPQAARNFVAATLTGAGIDDDTVEIAKLLTSELVTNAATHASRGQIHVAVYFETKGVRVVVIDAGRARAALPTAAPDPDEEHGRGWQLIEELSADCGIERLGGGNGHRAFFTLATDGGVR